MSGQADGYARRFSHPVKCYRGTTGARRRLGAERVVNPYLSGEIFRRTNS